jgi:hypothetical protein
MRTTAPRLSDTPEQAAVMKKDLAELARHDLIPALVRLLVDAQSVIRLHACGALRNIAAVGGADVVAQFQRADAWSVLERSLHDALNSRDAYAGAIAAQVLAVMEVLCLYSPVVCERRAPGAVGLLSRALANPFCAEACCKLLHSAVEGNAALAEAVAAHAALMAGLREVVAAGQDVARVYACGAVIGTLQAVAVLVEVLRQALTREDLPGARLDAAVLGEAAELERAEHADAAENKEGEFLSRWMDRVHVQAAGLEIVANLGRGAEERGGRGADACLGAAARVLAEPALWYACCDFPPDAPVCVQMPVYNLQLRACECAQMFFSWPGAHVEHAEQVWGLVGTAVARYSLLPGQAHSDPHVHRLSAAVALLGSVAKAAASSGAAVPLADADVAALWAVARHAPVEIRALMASVLGVAGDVNESACAAQALVEVVRTDPSIVVAAEAADALIDFFSQESSDGMFKRLGATAALSGLLRDKRFQDGRAGLDSEDLERLAMVKDNLEAFVDWKRAG